MKYITYVNIYHADLHLQMHLHVHLLDSRSHVSRYLKSNDDRAVLQTLGEHLMAYAFVCKWSIFPERCMAHTLIFLVSNCVQEPFHLPVSHTI